MKKTGEFMGNATTPMVTDTTTKVSMARVSIALYLLLTHNSYIRTLFFLLAVEVTVRGKVGLLAHKYNNNKKKKLLEKYLFIIT